MGRGAAREHSEVGRRLLREVEGIFGAVAALFLVASFLSYDPNDVGGNLCGPVGHATADVLVPALGFATYLVPLYLGLIAWQLFREDGPAIPIGRAAGCGVLVLTMATALSLGHGDGTASGAGGWLGGFIASELRAFLGVFGATIVAAALLVLSLLLSTDASLPEVGRGVVSGVSGAVQSGVGSLRQWWGSWMERRRAKAEEARRPAIGGDAGGKESKKKAVVLTEPVVEVPAIGTMAETKPAERTRRRRSKGGDQAELPFGGSSSSYRVPSVTLLDPPVRTGVQVDEEGLLASARILENKLRDFGVEGKVVAVQPGPVITTFEFEPAAGVKVNRIVTLADDLSMALRALSVRILAPVPGKPVVGIEVSNNRREKVFVREILESEEFAGTRSLLALGLGKDTTGRPVVADLGRMPHLLIAGATGTGKSVSINAMILSVLFRSSPEDVRFIMIDPKMLELSIYEEIPHLLVPVVTDPKRAAAALNNVIREMQYRYRLLHAKGVRNLESYNRLVARQQAEAVDEVVDLEAADEATEEVEETPERVGLALSEDAPLVHQHLPHIVIVIDEFADLMMSCGRDIETAVTRLAQKARAAGIHLLLATQRPSVDVITGLIKANFPARVSFQVTSRPDSRTILDCIGAERLLGEGDMLFLPPGTAKVQRLHGGFVSDEEVVRVVEFVKQQGRPEYRMELLEDEAEAEADPLGDEEPYDEMYDDAVRVVTESRQASISWVQRRLRIGYNRAARIVERMEKEGVVSASEGGRPREVLVQPIDGIDG